MASKGRAFAVAVAVTVLLLGAAVLAVGAWATVRNGGEVSGLAVVAVADYALYLTPLCLVSAVVWIAWRAARTRSSAMLGTEGALVGFAAAVVLVVLAPSFRLLG